MTTAADPTPAPAAPGLTPAAAAAADLWAPHFAACAAVGNEAAAVADGAEAVLVLPPEWAGTPREARAARARLAQFVTGLPSRWCDAEDLALVLDPGAPDAAANALHYYSLDDPLHFPAGSFRSLLVVVRPDGGGARAVARVPMLPAVRAEPGGPNPAAGLPPL